MRAETTEDTERTIKLVRQRAGDRRTLLVAAALGMALICAGLAFLLLVARDHGDTKVMVHDQAAPHAVIAPGAGARASVTQAKPAVAVPEKTPSQNAFRLEKSRKAVAVGPLMLRLSKADPKRGEYELSVITPRRSVPRRHLKVNRPLRIALGRNKGAVEIVATSIQKNAVEGFWSESEELPQVGKRIFRKH
jgi:hypothetical protein